MFAAHSASSFITFFTNSSSHTILNGTMCVTVGSIYIWWPNPSVCPSRKYNSYEVFHLDRAMTCDPECSSGLSSLQQAQWKLLHTCHNVGGRWRLPLFLSQSLPSITCWLNKESGSKLQPFLADLCTNYREVSLQQTGSLIIVIERNITLVFGRLYSLDVPVLVAWSLWDLL